MRYEVNPDTYAINIYNDEDSVPFHYQPDYPNGDKFDSVEEASQWAQLSIDAHLDSCLVYAPNGKGLQGEAKPDPKAREKVLAKLGITEDEARALFR